MTALSIAMLGRGSAANDGTGDSARDGALKLNKNARLLEALAKGAVISATTTAQPASPTVGDLYIIPSGKTGTDWSAMTNGSLALYAENDGANAWFEITPAEGWRMYARDANVLYLHNGSAWAALTAATAAVGTSGHALPYCDGAVLWSATQTFAVPPVFSDGAGTRAALGIETGQTWTSTSAGAIGPLAVIFHNSPSPASSDLIGLYVFKGNDSGGNATNYGDMRCYIDDPTNGSEDSQLQWYTCIGGAYALRMQLLNGLLMAGATGGDKGAGTINAVGVYDDNVLLTDYVFDLHLNGKLHPDDEGDARALGFDTDWLDPDVFAMLWRDRRALPTMPRRSEWRENNRPSVGALARMLWETVEVQAVHIEQLNRRLKALENKA